ncbi:Mitochondrial ubiquitin ligase activator of NFKB 1 [Nymphaea thermarum]|nr:Mitochondrial ubiquitin ligase activator of NFKB 1 [Nymphaea thermarum]
MATYDPELVANVLARVALAGDGAVLGLTVAVVAVRTWLKFRYNSAALKAIRHAPSVRISDLRSLLCDADSPDSTDAKLVVVRGSVGFKESLIVSPDSGAKGVIIQKTQTCLYNEWRGVFGWTSDWRALFGRPMKEQVVTSFRVVPFVIMEDVHGSPSSNVDVKLEGSGHPLPLVTVYHQMHPVQVSPYTVFQCVFGHGYPIGLLDEEKILPPGREITAVGLCSLQNGVPEIKPCKQLPCFLSELTKDQLVTKLAKSTKVLFWGGMLLSTLSVGILAYAIIRNWSKLKEWRFWRRPYQEQSDPLADVRTDDVSEDVPDGELCIICLMRRKRSAFIPCGHLVCCPHCAALVERESSPKCPVCRQSIRASIRIYDS